MAKVFVSYARVNAPVVDDIVLALEVAGHSVWIDRAGLRGGRQWRSEIVAAIEACDVFTIVLTQESAMSRRVAQELNLADDREKIIVPVVLQSVELPPEMELALSGLHRIQCAGNDIDEIGSTLNKSIGELTGEDERSDQSEDKLMDDAYNELRIWESKQAEERKRRFCGVCGNEIHPWDTGGGGVMCQYCT